MEQISCKLQLLRFLYLTFFCFFTGTSNLLCNGDFELYSTTLPFTDSFFDMHTSDPNCWYDKGGGLIEVKHYISIATTKGSELCADYPIDLCQTVILDPGI